MADILEPHHDEGLVEEEALSEPEEEDDSEASEPEEADSDDEDDLMVAPPDTPLPERMAKDDPRRMWLTRDEHRWALDIKDCLNMLPDVDATDFMCAQLAIICKDNLEDAMRRAQGIQTYQEEYKILDTLEDGMRVFSRHVSLFPKHWLTLTYSHTDETYVFMQDIAELDMSQLTTPRRVDDWFAGCYYIHALLCPDFATIRTGAIVCVECVNHDWQPKTRQGNDGKLILKMMSELLAHFPCRFICKNYHTGVMFNLFIATLRKLLPSEFKDMYQVGCDFDGHLGDAMLTPTVELANLRLLGRMEHVLKRRYDNEKSFKLLEDYSEMLAATATEAEGTLGSVDDL